MRYRKLILCGTFLTCGGQITIVIPPSSSDFMPPPADAVPYDQRLGALAAVPGGKARVGNWKFDKTNLVVWKTQDGGVPTSLDLSALSCSASDGAGSPDAFSAEVIVAPFRLMTSEVTNQTYAICVDSGACAPPDLPTFDSNLQPTDWRSPTIVQRPVILNWTLARAFCRHYGGDLPTAGEYARAAVGDAETYAQSTLLGLVLSCAMSPTLGQPQEELECRKLGGRLGPLADVATDVNDVGPFGHYDLYANAEEWTRGFFGYGTASWCSVPIYEHDVALSYPGSVDTGVDALVYFPNLGVPDPQTPMPTVNVSPDVPRDTHWTIDAQDWTPLGFRCAFPTE